MPAQQKTMTAPRATIKVNGQAVGLIRNLRVTETIQRGSVMGLGRLTKKEMPALSITCTWSCDQYLIDLKDTGIPGLNNRDPILLLLRRRCFFRKCLLHLPLSFFFVSFSHSS